MIGLIRGWLQLPNGATVSFYLLLLIAGVRSDNTLAPYYLKEILTCTLLFLSVRFYIYHIGKERKLSNLPLYIFAMVSGIESVYGILQICGILHPNNSHFILTGTFSNPGPYGIFLAISIVTILQPLFSTTYRLAKVLFSLSILLALVLLPATMSRTAILSLCCGIVPYIFRFKQVRDRITEYLYIILPLVVILSIVLYLIKRESAECHLYIGQITTKIIFHQPILGAGIGSWGSRYGTQQANLFSPHLHSIISSSSSQQIERMTHMADAPENAFNEYLSIAAECGVPAAILFTYITIWGIRQLYKMQSPWCYTLIGIATASLFSYPLHLPIFQYLYTFIIAITLPTTVSYKTSHHTKPICISLVSLLISIVSYNAFITHSSLNRWNRAKRIYDIGLYEQYIELASPLYKQLSYNYIYLYMLGHALHKADMFNESNRILLEGCKISCDPMFRVIIGKNYFQLREYSLAEYYYLEAFNIAPNRLYPLFLLAELYKSSSREEDLRFIIDNIDGFHTKVENHLTESIRENFKLLE